MEHLINRKSTSFSKKKTKRIPCRQTKGLVLKNCAVIFQACKFSADCAEKRAPDHVQIRDHPEQTHTSKAWKQK